MSATDLEERLARLADGEVATTVPSPDDLWTRGRRWQRRRTLVTSVVVGCVLALVGGTTVWGARGGLVPATVDVSAAGRPNALVSIPDMVWDTSPWLETLAGGPVVAIKETDRGGWWGSEPAVAAISAHGGEYGFLDLPGYALGAVLSRDGRRVAYWVAGTPSEDPQTMDGQVPPITAVAVRDLVTGELWRHDFPTAHGLDGEDLLWLDAATVAGNHQQWAAGDAGPEDSPGMFLDGSTWRWDLSRGTPREWQAGAAADVLHDALATTQDGVTLLATGNRIWWLQPEEGEPVRLTGRYRWASHSGVPLIAWSSESSLASVGGGPPNMMPNKVQVAVVEGPESVLEWRTVPRSGGTFGVEGWRDGKVLAHSRMPDGSIQTALYALDPDDGTRTPLVMAAPRAEGLGLLSLGWQWARDLLETAEIVPGEEPPAPVDPRLVVGLASAGVVALLVGLLAWRRRGHP